ncbi:MAG: transketolase C-terminal domain-containing protein [Casimicrobiaceae bacterium]
MSKVFFREAIVRALDEQMRADPRVILLGQDIGTFGGAYREFAGLYSTFGAARVRDMPVAEQAMVAIGIGAAAGGLRPLVNITYMDFLMLALDPLVNYAAKVRYKTGGQVTAPVVIKTTAGARGQGVAHSQCLEAWLMAVPGLRVVAPSNAADAYFLLSGALRHDGPVVFVDHKRLFPTAGELTADPPFAMGRAAVARAGDDLTIVAHSYMVTVALAAAVELARSGISCEVVDLRSLAPLDVDCICDSVARTRRMLTLEEGQVVCGVGAEVAYRVTERLGPLRVSRIGALPAPVSSNPVLERLCVPDVGRVVASARRLLDDHEDRRGGGLSIREAT